MRKLFLASYFTEVSSLLPILLEEEILGKKIVFIPTAALHEENAFYTNEDRKSLKKLGFIVEELEISNATEEEIRKSITSTDYIFVGGGNTFFLLQELKRKGADKLIINHIEKGKLYIGTSAGSIIMQKDIISDGTENLDIAPDLNGDFSALSIINFYLYVHYGHNYWGDDDQYISKYYAKLDLKKISDKQVITVSGEKIEIITVS